MKLLDIFKPRDALQLRLKRDGVVVAGTYKESVEIRSQSLVTSLQGLARKLWSSS